MKNIRSNKLFITIKEAQAQLSRLSSVEKKNLEKSWDIEHPYYSSALEGSKIDRKDFEKLAEGVK